MDWSLEGAREEQVDGGGLEEGLPASSRLVAAEWRITLLVRGARLVLLDEGEDGRFVLPLSARDRKGSGGGLLWLLPERIDDPGPALLIHAPGAPIEARRLRGSWRVTVHAKGCGLQRHPNRPRRDLLGAAFSLDFRGGEALAATLAAFYWDSLVPMTIERTRAARYPISKGYVLSSLQAGSYGGTYPAVDHEFQVKGRLAIAGGVERDLVRRMLSLQLELMRGAPDGSWRNPCALQPRGAIEYHVTRRSLDLKTKATMFFVTGNVEFLEELWLHAAQTKDRGWVGSVIGDAELVAAHVERQVDAGGRLWSDVYYEDQVMKDGRETIAQAFAANSLRRLAELEDWLGRPARAGHWRALADRLLHALALPLPEGYWDPAAARFVDWVDRAGKTHDHLHLLAAELPILFGAASDGQAAASRAVLAGNEGVFQKFPSFVAARIEDYTRSEIGTGGPYDLCAAGRYWCWDAAYWASVADGARLRSQLEAVAGQAALDGWLMGERYDMNYVYYKSGRNWHGAAHYYEYPNVFARVLLVEWLGFHPDLEADIHLRPLAEIEGGVRLETEGLRWAWRLEGGLFTVENLAGRDRRIRLDLSGLWAGSAGVELVEPETGAAAGRAGHGEIVDIPARSRLVARPAGPRER